jgi:hypothetical protein
MRTLAITFLVLAVHPVTGLCQAPDTTRPLSRGDVTVSIGAFSASHVVSGEACCNTDWSSSLFKGVGAGYYWTDHLKTEIAVAWPGPTEAYGYFDTRLADGTRAYGYEEHSYRTLDMSLGQSYQFGRNAVFHPFVGAGLDITRERDRNDRTTETSRGLVQSDVTDTTVVHARAFVATGFKAYFSERAFFRGELKVDFGSRSGGIDQMAWKAGFGVDF